jgi:hypothetical protein
MDDVFAKIAEKIIAQQETIIGPVAISQAQGVQGLSLDWTNHSVTLSGDEKEILEELIEAYRDLFGQVAVEASKEAAGTLVHQLQPEQLPELLK